MLDFYTCSMPGAILLTSGSLDLDRRLDYWLY
jgi:hypothetical protein